MFVPVSLPQNPRLKGLSLDTSSSWHTSALLATAIESATLPSRLKDGANRDTLGGIAELLNLHGKQTVANLQMSFSDASEVPHSDGVGDGPSDGMRLDMDFRPQDDLDQRSRRQNGHHNPHIFSQVLASRGQRAEDEEIKDEAAEEDMREKRDRREPISRRLILFLFLPTQLPSCLSSQESQANLPCRYRSTLSYPLPDSFPVIFKNEGGEPLKSNLAVTTALSTDTALSDRLKLLRSTVVRSIGLEDREMLGNDLAEMADEYHEGWSSGSDYGEDD